MRRAGTAEGFAFGLHVPGGADQFPDNARQLLRRDRPCAVAFGARAEPQVAQRLLGGPLRRGVAQQVRAVFGEPDAAARGGAFHPAAAVVQQQPRHVLHLAGRGLPLTNPQAQAGRRAALLELQGRVQIHGRKRGAVQQPFAARDRAPGRKSRSARHPAIARPMAKAPPGSKRASLPRASRKPPSTSNAGSLKGMRSSPRDKTPGDVPLVAVVLPQFQAQSPGCGVIPLHRLEVRRGALAAVQPSGGAHPRKQRAGQPVRERLAVGGVHQGGIKRVRVILLPAQDSAGDVGVGRVRQRSSLFRRQPHLLENRPVAILLLRARKQFHGDPAGALGGGDVDDIPDLGDAPRETGPSVPDAELPLDGIEMLDPSGNARQRGRGRNAGAIRGWGEGESAVFVFVPVVVAVSRRLVRHVQESHTRALRPARHARRRPEPWPRCACTAHDPESTRSRTRRAVCRRRGSCERRSVRPPITWP